MDLKEKERYQAKVEARLNALDQSLHEIKSKAEQRKANTPELQLGSIMRKHNDAKAKLEVLKSAGANEWGGIQSELDGLFKDIDDQMREALSYFK